MERRKHPRRSVLSQVGAYASEQHQNVVLMDISRNGARILLPVGSKPAIQDTVALKMGVMPTIMGKVSRVQGRIAGVEFTNVLHPSLVASAKRLCEEGRAEGQVVIG
ncbi:PilZ domain-containing protein [Parerythrobacter aestuarii]|uniref:PilZ domain-containing protein n=1 Tax=Parerythrobacter aestuarii TaxID=3020909 RepID=UPI0024DE793F|nr:PilZ domain-containing protein [Parerythrobacter aestuarii]